MKRFLSLLLIGVFTASGCSVTRQVTPQFSQKLEQTRRIAVMPPQIKMFEFQAGGTTEEMDEWNAQVGDVAASAIDEYLKTERLLDVKFVNEQFLRGQYRELWNDTEVLYEAVAASAFVHTLSDQKFSTKLKNFDYTLGIDVRPMADDLEADALLFIYGYDYVSTKGRLALQTFNTLASTALSVFAGGVVVALFPQNSPSFLSMGLVDGQTGDLIWFKIIPPNRGHDFLNPQSFAKTIQWMLEDLNTELE